MIRLMTPEFRRETRANLRLALPLIAAQIASIGMGTADTIFAGRLGRETLAAVAVGTNLNIVFFVFFMGVLMACSAIVAQRAGAGQADARVGVFTRDALLLALLLATLWVIGVHLLANRVLTNIGLDAGTAQIAVDFLCAYSWAAYGFCLWFVLRYTAEGVGCTTPVLVSGLAGLGSNILLDWVFMYGKFGMPVYGAVGCGYATTISSLLMALVLALQYRRHDVLRRLQVFVRELPQLAANTREIVRLGLPIGLILVAEAGLFALAALWMARFGDDAVAAFQVAINFAAVLFMIPMSLGLATTVRVGHAIGAGDPQAARLRGIIGMKLGLLNAVSNASIMLLCSGLIAKLYTDNVTIAAMAVRFLWLAAAFQFFDGLQVTANGALRGIKDTRIPMMITVTAYWLVGMPVAWGLGFHTPLDTAGIWWGLTAGLAAAALGLSLRFLSKAQRLKQMNRVRVP
jgi:MATE family multidrug resistance protein